MKNVALFLICVAFSSVALSKLDTMRSEPTVAVAHKDVILGHRIGPMGQEMLVTK